MSTIASSDQSSVFSIFISVTYSATIVDAMATTAPQAGTSTPVSTAAKRPAKTQTFLKSLCAALSIFDDEIATLTEVRETAYETFVTAYKEAFAKIWPKIDGADITIILHSVKDTELHELRRLSEMLCPDKEQPTLVEEKRNVPTLDNILGHLVNKIPQQKLPDKETCSLISDIFSNLAEAHRYYATAAKGLADVASLVSPEQLTVVLAAAVPPTLQLVLPPGQISPLLAPPLPPKTSTTPSDGKELIQFCKNNILPDPTHSAFNSCDARTPTRVLAAAVYCTLEKHLFDKTTPHAEVASKFCVTAAQLHKAITGIDYKSGPHVYKKRRKAADPAASTSQTQKAQPSPSSKIENTAHPSPSSKIEKTSDTQETFQEPDDPNPAYDTLSSSSSDSLYNPFG